tara:strand:+ start:414 stop:974 length:561 start_codon:yes stop_codon:yes gene_type:complete
MRIISGKLKGKSIKFFKNLITRPLKDSVKENIFNILMHSNLINVKINKSNILDLYSGIGSFGLECISREAKKVTFVEQDQNASIILKKNLVKLAIIEKAKIINDKIENFIALKTKDKYDIFFLDPPFADENFIHILQLLKKNKIYKKNHIIIIHREKNSKDNFKGIINTLLIKKYARSKIFFGIFN